MRKTAIVLLFGVTTAALVSLCVVQHRQIQRLSAKLALSAPVVAPAAAIARNDSGVVARESQGEQKRLTAAVQRDAGESDSPIKPPAAAAQAATAASKSSSAPKSESPMASIVKMMKTPGMKDMIRTQQKGQMDLSYASLFKYLQLSDEDLETFKGVLLDRQMALMSVSLDLMNSATTPEERKTAADRIKETTADYDARIKEFLGDENYGVFQSFEATQPERMQVTMFKGALNPGEQMTEEQEDNLIRTMHDARTNFQFSVAGFGDKQTPDPSMFTPDRMAKLLEDSAKLQEQYVARAAAILTPGQLEQFKTMQKQQQDMQEMGMKMAASMFGQPSKEASASSP